MLSFHNVALIGSITRSYVFMIRLGVKRCGALYLVSLSYP